MHNNNNNWIIQVIPRPGASQRAHLFFDHIFLRQKFYLIRIKTTLSFQTKSTKPLSIALKWT